MDTFIYLIWQILNTVKFHRWQNMYNLLFDTNSLEKLIKHY